MLGKNETLKMSQDTFRLLRDFIKNHCGLYFDDSSMFLFEKRLARRVEVYRLKNFEEYYHLLRYDKRRDEELTSVIDILTVNETYFFREESQLKAFIGEVMPDIMGMKRDRKKIRIWSAGCSTGEEPYTIAMLLLEKNLIPEWEIEILGSDINQRVLHVARKGAYKKSAFRSTEMYYLKKYFIDEGDGTYRVVDSVKNLVNFGFLNLLDPFKVGFIGEMDIIFCRNVIIYFDQETKKKVVSNFYDRLREGGYLLLGHSESLMNISTAFVLKHLKTDLVYQKAAKAVLTGELR